MDLNDSLFICKLIGTKRHKTTRIENLTLCVLRNKREVFKIEVMGFKKCYRMTFKLQLCK